MNLENSKNLFSFSQEIEDLFLDSKFPSGYLGFYVDIGAHHPTRFSNTALFYEKGWRGINIEANKEALAKFASSRMRDINLCLLVGAKNQNIPFYIFDEPALNTVIKKRAKLLQKTTAYNLLKKIKKRCVTLKYIFKKYLPKNQQIDFLNIDVEGNEIKVLQGNDWYNFRPSYLLIEILNENLQDVLTCKVTKFLNKKSYIPFAKIGRTAFFVDSKAKNILEKKTSKQDKRIYILCPFFRREKELLELLKNLKVQTYVNYKLILINCNRKLMLLRKISLNTFNAKILNAEGFWWAQALDLGFKYLKSLPHLPNSFVLILNQDVQLPVKFLESGLKAINELNVDLLGATSFSPNTGKLEDSGVVWDWENASCRNASSPKEINCLSTRGLLIRMDIFLKLGSFRSCLLPHYLSDYAYTIRAFRNGCKLGICKRYYLFHKTYNAIPEKIIKNFLPRLQFIFSNKCKNNPLQKLLFIWSSFPNLRTKINATRKCFAEAKKLILGDTKLLQ